MQPDKECSETSQAGTTPGPPRRLSNEEKEALIRRFNEGVLLSNLLPFMAPGGITVTEIDCLCVTCGQAIAGTHVSVIQSEFPPGVTTFDCIGVCAPCRAVSKFLYRFRSNGVIETLVGHRWVIKQWKKEQRRWWDLAGRIIAGLRSNSRPS